ncbi:hypothetical protein DSM43518_02061 [Mycobacterium marinum]|nr:hypothetical protein [Mycobacterium marinum]AXN50981.1 hypothetical protein CCUG20998_03579 [Mycobacterium marinum]RFZ11221.1 hypothetical protein DSM43518_02061 [Mycobacterium marinum]RFZ25422.1 hypothetical protein DSM43519_01608 [Mycobacterium marinum]RFZ28308.1 hypothetical protein DSM44344_01353 [Mycobacterium marinum]RFZ33864.1 hypothetical protein NCTC2275_02710 [Mycobacterium marinum]
MSAYEHELTEWQYARSAMTEWEWAPFDDPETHADTMSADGTRL